MDEPRRALRPQGTGWMSGTLVATSSLIFGGCGDRNHPTPPAATASAFPSSSSGEDAAPSPFPARARVKTSHCDTPRFGGPAATFASRAAFEPRGCPLGCQPKPETQRLAWGLLPVVHFLSIDDGLRNVFPSFNLTCYKLKKKSPSVGEEGGAVSSPLANPL